MIDPQLLPRAKARIELRRLSAADLADFQAYRHDTKVGLYQGWSPMSDSEAITFLETMNSAALLQPGEWCQIGITERETDTLIGDIGICVDLEEEEAEMGFSLRRQSHGIGLGSEAVREAIVFLFEGTPIDRVICITDARNLPAARMLRPAGPDYERDLSRRGVCRTHILPFTGRLGRKTGRY